MTGTRVLGLPCQHLLALEVDRNASPVMASQGDDHDALRGFALHGVKNN